MCGRGIEQAGSGTQATTEQLRSGAAASAAGAWDSGARVRGTMMVPLQCHLRTAARRCRRPGSTGGSGSAPHRACTPFICWRGEAGAGWRGERDQGPSLSREGGGLSLRTAPDVTAVAADPERETRPATGLQLGPPHLGQVEQLLAQGRPAGAAIGTWAQARATDIPGEQLNVERAGRGRIR